MSVDFQCKTVQRQLKKNKINIPQQIVLIYVNCQHVSESLWILNVLNISSFRNIW